MITEALILITFLAFFLTLTHQRIKDQEKDLKNYHFKRGPHVEAKNF